MSMTLNILKSALDRKAKYNQTFCSYKFREVSNYEGKTQISVAHSSTKPSTPRCTKFQRQTTASISFQRLKSYKSMRSIKIRSESRTKTTIFEHKPYCKLFAGRNRTHQKENISLLNKFEQYEEDRKILNEKPEQFFFFSPPFSQQLKKENEEKMRRLKLDKQNKFNQTFGNLQILKDFHCMNYPDLFITQNQELNHADQNFSEFFLINANNKKYYKQEIEQLNFNEIPMREAALKLNQFSTKSSDCVFFCAFLKPKNKNNTFRYNQNFFWISQPIKHQEKSHIEETIQRFYENLKRFQNSGDFKDQKLLNQKIWIIDWRGTLSYISKQKLLSFQHEEKKKKAIQIENGCLGTQIMCMQMFRNTILKGIYHKEQKNQRILPM